MNSQEIVHLLLLALHLPYNTKVAKRIIAISYNAPCGLLYSQGILSYNILQFKENTPC